MPLDEQVYMKALRASGLRRTSSSGTGRPERRGGAIERGADSRLGDRIVGAVALNTDISARIAEEAELRAAVEFRDRILAVLSHDVRNPLGVILTSAGMLERQLANAGAGNQLAAMRRIIDNAHQIERMVHDLLDYTRTRQGRRLPIAAATRICWRSASRPPTACRCSTPTGSWSFPPWAIRGCGSIRIARRR